MPLPRSLHAAFRALAVSCSALSAGAVAVPAQASPPRAHEFREVHLGMEVRLVLVLPGDSIARARAALAYARIEALDRVMSDYRPASELSRLAATPVGEWVGISPDLNVVLAHAAFAAAATAGAFDHTVGPLTQLWREAARTGQPIADSARARAKRSVGYRFVELDSARQRVRFLQEGMRLDLGAIAKGWILDEVARVLDSAGVRDLLLEAGGEIVTRGAPPGEQGWAIAIETSRGDTLLTLTDAAVSTSASRAQLAPAGAGGHEGHVFRTTTARGAVDTPQLTVIGRTAWMTDAFATAFALMDPPARRELAARLQLLVVEP